MPFSDLCRADLQYEVMARENQVAGDCQYFYLGFTDSREENNFVNVYTGQPMVGHTWAPNQPNNFDNQDCAVGRKDSGRIYDMSCSFTACPLCEVSTMTTFQLSGLCQGITMDRYFLLLEVNNARFCSCRSLL